MNISKRLPVVSLITVTVLLLNFQNCSDMRSSANLNPATSNVISGSNNNPAAQFISVKDYGAIGNGAHDDTDAIRAALGAFPSGYVKIHFPIGTYLISDTIHVAAHRVFLEGEGKWATQIVYNPAKGSSGVAFLFENSDSSADMYQNGISEMGILSGDKTSPKVAIKLVATSEFRLKNIAIWGWTGGGSPGSIGLQIQGHELGHIEDLSASADSPIVVQSNPNPTDGRIDIDHFNFNNIYLIASPQNPCISIASGVNVTNVTFDGAQAWVSGNYGLYWNDHSTTQVSSSLAIHNVRWEQSTNANGYGIYISHHVALQNLQIDNYYSGTGASYNGIYLHGILNANLKNVFYAGTLVGLYTDSSVQQISLGSSWFQVGSEVNLASAVGVTGDYIVNNGGGSGLDHIFILPTTTPPTSSLDSCVKGQMSFDGNYLYVCVATNVWKRSLLSSF